MKSSKLLRKVTIAVVMLPIVFLLIIWLVNLAVFDEDLNPDLARILQPVAAVPHTGNAYYAMWGISTAADRDMIESGVRLVERYRDKRANSGLDTLTPEDYSEILGSKNLGEPWLADYYCNARTRYGCLANARESFKESTISARRSLLMLARHQQILQMQLFGNWGGSSFSSPIPPYGTFLKLSQFKLADLSEVSRPADFLQQLKLDMQFWKLMLAEGSELIDKMFAIAGIWTNVQFLSEYLARNDLSVDELNLAMTLLQPLSANELNLANAFISEQRSMFRSLNKHGYSMLDLGPLVSPWLIQENAVLNSYYEHVIEPVVYLSGLDGAEFFAQTPLREQKNRDKSDAYGRAEIEAMTSIWPGTLYNLGGKVLLSKLLGYPADYIARVHDLNSMIAMVKFQLVLQQEGLDSAGEIMNAVNAAASSSDSLLAARGLKFDSDAGWLQFDCLYERSMCKINLYASNSDRLR